MTTTISLTPQELAHVLAGLRMIQEHVEEDVATWFPQLGEVENLTTNAIDDLCERINCGKCEPNISINVYGGVVQGVRSDVPVSVCVFDEDSDFDSAEEFNQAKDEYESLPLGVY